MGFSVNWGGGGMVMVVVESVYRQGKEGTGRDEEDG